MTMLTNNDAQKFAKAEIDARIAVVTNAGSSPWDLVQNSVTARAADPYEATSLALRRRLDKSLPFKPNMG